MKKFYIIFAIVLVLGCAKDGDTVVLKQSTVTQNCTVNQVEGSAVISCPDGTQVTLPPTVVIQTETIEIPVIVEVPSECHHDHGNHYGQDKHD